VILKLFGNANFEKKKYKTKWVFIWFSRFFIIDCKSISYGLSFLTFLCFLFSAIYRFLFSFIYIFKTEKFCLFFLLKQLLTRRIFPVIFLFFRDILNKVFLLIRTFF